MKLPIFALTTIISSGANTGASAQRLSWSNLRRHLSYERIAGYAPGSQVTDHCAIDLDQAALETQLALKTNESFENARSIYTRGGHSKSYALITLETPLTSNLAKGTAIRGVNANDNEVSGKAYEDYKQGDSVIKVQYSTTDIQASYVECRVGGLLEEDRVMEGCLKGDTGDVNINGVDYSYTYEAEKDNVNGRTLQGFSTEAQSKMRTDCTGCPYADFTYFYDYYGTDDYANQWVMAAFDGEKTSFKNGNADFSQYGFDGRVEAIKKGTAYMNVFMYVIREFEDALDDCENNCINCNDDPVHAWDEGVCFYTGSIEGQDGLTPDGKLLHQLADKRCSEYKTCGIYGTDLEGTSQLNYQIMELFSLGNFQLQSGNCPGARETTKKITEKMYIPLIQGTLRYAYKVGKLQGGEKEAAEGAVFAAAVLPRIHAADAGAAKVIYENMRVGASSTDADSVRSAFESVYPKLGISCSDVGGLWNEAEKKYFEGWEPCTDVSVMSAQMAAEPNNKGLAIGLGVTFGALFVLAVLYIVHMRNREKAGKPVFAPHEEPKGFE